MSGSRSGSGVEAVERQSTRADLIKHWGLQVRMPVVACLAPAPVVCHHQNDVGERLSVHRRKKQDDDEDSHKTGRNALIHQAGSVRHDSTVASAATRLSPPARNAPKCGPGEAKGTVSEFFQAVSVTWFR